MTYLPSRVPGLLVVLLLAGVGPGCGATNIEVFTDDGGADGGTTEDSAVVPDRGGTEDSGGGVRCGATTCSASEACCEATGRCYDPRCLACCMPRPDPDAGVSDGGGSTDAEPPRDTGPTPFCALVDCVTGTRCCEALRRCIDPTMERCPGDPPPPIDGGTPRRCNRSADCGGAQECVFPESACVRDGVCMVAIMCFRPETFCSCEGVTYLGCRPDRPTRSRGACGGVVDGGSSFCAVALCAPATRCCEALRRCIDPTREACPGDPPPLDGGTRGCARAADCRGDQECVFPDGVCAREGVCTAAIACIRPETFCSCEGATYAACRPDRPTRARGACPDAGTGACRTDADCPTGFACCGATARCYDRRCLACCMTPPPDAGTRACRSNAECASDQWCAGSGCGTAGSCERRPTACPTVFAPVCGCDGREYSNSCVAAAAGVRMASPGRCGATVDAGAPDSGSSFCATVRCRDGFFCCEALRECVPAGSSCPGVTPPDAGTGRRCTTSADCGTGGECIYPENVCVRDGKCMGRIDCLRPETFCSCTGMSYAACRPDRPTRARGGCPGTITDGGTAVDAGVACRTDRECPAGQACCVATARCYPAGCLSCCMPRPTDAGTGGCRSNAECASGEWCAGEACGTPGRCEARPGACIEIYAPVCGCDGRTYPNSCYAAAAGMRFEYRGTCRGSP